jgi:NDP-sugar pyrophosphorylase family protein
MRIIVPMAGYGDRFVNAGYIDPKPLIKVRGKRMFEYVVDMYDKDDEFTFICNEKHIENTDMYQLLKSYVKNCNISIIPPHKLGPVYTVLAGAFQDIDKQKPVIISYCDNPFTWDYNDFKAFSSDKDGVLVSNKGFHPHILSKTLMAHSNVRAGNRVLEVKEKACYTDNHFNEHASAGVYYFKHGSYVIEYFKRLMEEKLHYNNEYYVTLVYNLLIQDGLSVYSYLNDQVMAFGTPEEIQNFEAWQVILDGMQVKNEQDLIQCYNYWKKLRYVQSSSSR